MIKAVALLFGLQWLGDVLARLLHLPIPGALTGTLLLLVLLIVWRRIPDWLQSTTQAMLPHMMLVFIPTVAGVMVQQDRIRAEWLPFLAACVLGAVVTLAATALTMRWAMRLQSRADSGVHGV